VLGGLLDGRAWVLTLDRLGQRRPWRRAAAAPAWPACARPPGSADARRRTSPERTRRRRGSSPWTSATGHCGWNAWKRFAGKGGCADDQQRHRPWSHSCRRARAASWRTVDSFSQSGTVGSALAFCNPPDRAARAVLELGSRLRETIELEERIAALEGRQNRTRIA
jgi:hypothetical protein